MEAASQGRLRVLQILQILQVLQDMCDRAFMEFTPC